MIPSASPPLCKFYNPHSCSKSHMRNSGTPGDGPEELAVMGATANHSWANGFYCQDGIHSGKAMYTKAQLQQCDSPTQFQVYGRYIELATVGDQPTSDLGNHFGEMGCKWWFVVFRHIVDCFPSNN